MITIDLQRYKSELSSFLSIGKRWLFVPGYVYTTNDARNVFARMTMPGLEAKEATDPLMIMDKLEDVLKRKTIKSIKIMVDPGHILIDSKELVAQIPIGREDKPDDVIKLQEYNQRCVEIEQSENEFEGLPVCKFDVKRDIFIDALDIAKSPSEPIRIETGKSVRIISDSGQVASMPEIHASPALSIGLSMQAQECLRATFQQDVGTVRVKIAGSAWCVFKNPRLTVMAGGLRPKVES